MSILENVWGDNVNTLNFAASGTMVVDRANPERGEFSGVLQNVRLAPLRYDTGQHHRWGGWDYDAAGDCLQLAEVPFDTFGGTDEPCTTSGDCRNQKSQVCDPLRQVCTENQCSESLRCDDGESCKTQSEAYGTGACYPSCVPFTSEACPAGMDCVSSTYDGSAGVCKRQGDAPIGTKECTASTSSTGCEPGAVCQAMATFWPREQYCHEVCDYFATDPGCSAGLCQLKIYRDKDFVQYCWSDRCHLGGTCRAETDADPAAIGEVCEAEAGTPCGPQDGRAARGLCDGDSENTCRETCRLAAPECPAGQSCLQFVHREQDDTVVEGIGVRR